MKSKLFMLVTSCVLILLFAACSNTPDTDNGTNVYLQWKLLNDSSFIKMKDSTAYTHYTIPAEKGGSSFYYKINTVGDSTSVSPLETDTIVANYRGRFMNGYIFEQSFKGDNPQKDSTAVPFRAITNRLIKGFSENLMQMKVGEYRTIVIPQELAYGVYGSNVIPPYSTLKFDIELISVKKKLK